jgi:hypothetical protein
MPINLFRVAKREPRNIPALWKWESWFLGLTDAIDVARRCNANGFDARICAHCPFGPNDALEEIVLLRGRR